MARYMMFGMVSGTIESFYGVSKNNMPISKQWKKAKVKMPKNMLQGAEYNGLVEGLKGTPGKDRSHQVFYVEIK
jgi:hypothetical protein